MDQLLESKKIRERDRLRAQDVKIKREREQEGDEYQDKDVFITTAYKQQQEELEKAAKIDKDEEGLFSTHICNNMYTNKFCLFREIICP